MGTIRLGHLVRDKVAGFEGIVTARTEFLFGCVRVGVQPRELDEDDEPRDQKWFDEPQLETLSTGMEEHRTPTFAEMEETGTAGVSTGGPDRAHGVRRAGPEG